MKTQPLRPARVEWAADGTPRAPDFGDVYHGDAGAAAQARQVFLAGNGLPRRWADRDDFTIFETGFGLGHNFIATWQAWRDDPQRPRCLHYLAVDAHPPRLDDLRRAHRDRECAELAQALLAASPPLVPGLHRLDFADGALRLMLAFGDVRDWLPEWRFAADAFYLDGFAPALNPAMWDRAVLRTLGHRAAPGATAATWSVARAVRDGLGAAGFACERRAGLGGKREVLQARYQPRRPPPPATPRPGRVLVLGAGLAGASCAAALAELGCAVEVIDRQAAPAEGSSGNPAGLFHATVHASDNPHARLFRAAALRTAQFVRRCTAVPQGVDGLLRLEPQRDAAAMQSLIDAQGLPADFVQALPAAEAGARAGVPLRSPAWWYPAGGWVSPADLVRTLLARPGIAFRGGVAVQALRRDGAQWTCVDGEGRALAGAEHLVLACAEQAGPLLQALGWPALPLVARRGQVSVLPAGVLPFDLRLPLAGDGYALPLPDGRVLCGASNRDGDDGDDPRPREQDHRANLQRLQSLCGLTSELNVDGGRLQGRVGWRVQAPDRLPLVGPLPLREIAPGMRLDQARLLPREPGLHLAVGFGGRGLTLAPLLGEVLAARLLGTPLPLEQSLVDAVDPGRWLVRAARKAAGG
ncbi:MAG: FAD-dependent 5-carboxymethylaminomethyl-2-thiouridine(34) oxidoreductase MnmC [Proteobacteria bacterium]|nr:FAD-dependent 5-carboxymethylaminomethyl-2-thiouridine(34) oxidoreductase MnmC [Pseudomonadota bacterium]